jgi:dolichyl-phosphate beta-glucosyltransferase
LTPVQWSVVVPAFNEAARLPRYLEEIVQAFDGRGEPYEVIVVDDASTDGTSEVVMAAARAHPAVRLLRLDANFGKGGTVKAGMLAARGRYRLFTDADGATPIDELTRLEAAIAAGADVAIGSRVLPDPGVSVTSRRHRVAAGRAFNWIRERLALRGIADSQCGFKLFRGPVAEDLFGRLRTLGFAFDVEILLTAQRAGYRVAEVPVNWRDQPGSKVRVLTDGPRMIWEILGARVRAGRTR